MSLPEAELTQQCSVRWDRTCRCSQSQLWFRNYEFVSFYPLSKVNL